LAATGTQTQSLTKADGGTLSLNGQAYYSGTTTVNGGTLNLNASLYGNSPSEYDLRQP